MRIAPLQSLLFCLFLLFPVVAHPQSGDRGSNPAVDAEDQLDRIVLNLSPTQFVGHVFRGSADVLLFDTSNALLSMFDLVDSPLVLSSQFGALTPSMLNDQALFDAGMIHLAEAGVTYRGPTGGSEIVASVFDITSTGVLVNFNGYDLLTSTFTDGSPISEIFQDLPTSILVSVQNSGNLIPENNGSQDRPFVRTYFKSGGGSVKRYFSGSSGGDTDTLSILLPDVTAPVGPDTLVVGVVAEFLLDDTLYQTVDSTLIPVEILPTPSIVVLPGTVTPDSLYANIGFSLGFDVQADNLVFPIDSTSVTARLIYEKSGTVATTLVSADSLTFDSPEPNLLQYRNISISAARLDVDTGWYRFEFDYALYAGTQSFVLNNIVSDSLLVASPPQMEYVAGSLEPLQVIGGSPLSFQFDVNLQGMFDAQLIGNRTTFSLESGTFSSTVSLRAAEPPLEPGVNRLVSDSVTVPLEYVPALLTPDAVVTFRRAGFGNSATLVTDFNSQQIELLSPLSIQLISTTVTGVPNAPLVNTNQPFEVTVEVCNVSDRAATNVVVDLATNGFSTLVNAPIVIDSIPSEDTATVVFDLIAAADATPSENFTASLTSSSAEVLPFVDNSASVTIQTPADLTLTCSISGLPNGYAAIGDRFAFGITMANAGQADVTSPVFRLTTNGVPLGITDPVLGSLVADSTISIIMTAPDFDTVATIDLRLLEPPLDVNTGLPAAISDTACSEQVLVTSLTPDLVVESEIPEGNVVQTGQDNLLFTLSLENLGQSARSDVLLEQITVRFEDGQGDPMPVRSVLDVGASGFAEDSEIITRSVAGNDLHVSLFDDYIIPQQASRKLRFIARVKKNAPSDFKLVLNASDIEAIYMGGPLAGEVAPAATLSGDSVVIAGPVSTAPAGAGSFTVRDNPFDPNDGPAVFSYSLSADSRVEFRVLTLTGEMVYERILTQGEAGTGSGPHELVWDGRNSGGDIVLNGVYLAVFTLPSADSQKIIKVAVVK